MTPSAAIVSRTARVAPERAVTRPALPMRFHVGPPRERNVRAIETEYRGHLFRSRLEARWAVFFDHMQIQWKYEPEGFTDGVERYLPDFMLPDVGCWVEVKGSHDGLVASWDKMVAFATALPPETGPEPCLLILGDVPEPDGQVIHWAMDARPGMSWAGFSFQRTARGVDPILNLFAIRASRHMGMVASLLGSDARTHTQMGDAVDYTKAFSIRCGGRGGFPLISQCYRAARAARFDHGADPRPDRLKS